MFGRGQSSIPPAICPPVCPRISATSERCPHMSTMKVAPGLAKTLSEVGRNVRRVEQHDCPKSYSKKAICLGKTVDRRSEEVTSAREGLVRGAHLNGNIPLLGLLIECSANTYPKKRRGMSSPRLSRKERRPPVLPAGSNLHWNEITPREMLSLYRPGK